MLSRRLAMAPGRFWKNQEGIAVTEYGLLIALVAVLLIGVVSVFSSAISSWFAAKTNTITSF
jgi:Flp pilus assembly pilin Flp